MTRNVVFRLAKKGYRIDVLAYWGQEGHTVTTNGVTIYPRFWHMIGKDALELIMKYNRPDIYVMLFDIWVSVEPDGSSWVAKCHPFSTCYVPVDHHPLPRLIQIALEQCYQPVAMCQYGYDQMMKAIEKGSTMKQPILISHGVDTQIFKPLNRADCRKELGLEESPFICGINAMNKGPRKRFPSMFAAFQQAAAQIGGPDKIKLYMNTDLRCPEGMDLIEMINRMEIKDYIVTTHPFARYAGITDQQLAGFYNSCDLLLNTCHSEDTKVLTEDGPKDVSNISIGDHVWGLDANRNLVLTPIQDVIIQRYRGRMIHFESKQFDLLVTPNHRIYYNTPKMRKKMQVRRAGDFLIKKTRYYLPTNGKWNCDDSDSIDGTQYNHGIQTCGNTLPTQISTATLLELIGWYVSEGSLGRNNRIVISNRKAENIARISVLFKKLNLHPVITKKDVQAWCKPLWRILEECGRGSHHKRIPYKWLQFSPRLLRHLYDGLMMGDGSRAGHHVLYYTVSDRLKDDFRLLCLKLGFTTKVWRRKSPFRKIDSHFTGPSESWMVSIREQHNTGSFKPKEHLHDEPYDGLVWCLKTSIENFFTERNGLITCSGNSAGEGFGLPILESMATGTPVVGTNFSSMIELIKGHGWLVDVAAYDMTGLVSWQALPNVEQIRDAILDAYHDGKKLRQYGKDSIAFAQQYDYESKILPLWTKYLDETAEQIKGAPST